MIESTPPTRTAEDVINEYKQQLEAKKAGMNFGNLCHNAKLTEAEQLILWDIIDGFTVNPIKLQTLERSSWEHNSGISIWKNTRITLKATSEKDIFSKVFFWRHDPIKGATLTEITTKQDLVRLQFENVKNSIKGKSSHLFINVQVRPEADQ